MILKTTKTIMMELNREMQSQFCKNTLLMRTMMLQIADHLEDNAYHLLGEGLGVPCRHLSKDLAKGSSLQRDSIPQVIQEIQ